MNVRAWAKSSYVRVVSTSTVDFVGNVYHAMTVFQTRRIARLVRGPVGV